PAAGQGAAGQPGQRAIGVDSAELSTVRAPDGDWCFDSFIVFMTHGWNLHRLRLATPVSLTLFLDSIAPGIIDNGLIVVFYITQRSVLISLMSVDFCCLAV
ncbi:hypothetical protein, partial [Pseudomonas chlororaphis]|uniref:hypothetical protein n=1 Tax=Pseudomonas chlororaphis TaxID=587753 RepID=UPI001B33236E